VSSQGNVLCGRQMKSDRGPQSRIARSALLDTARLEPRARGDMIARDSGRDGSKPMLASIVIVWVVRIGCNAEFI
jgi:hypothetical protein